MKHIFTLLICTILFANCANSQEIESITTQELKTVLATKKVQVLDVRTPAEVKEGAIENAIFVDFYQPDFVGEAIKKLDKDQPVYIYCRSGGRSMQASKKLKEKGFKVTNVIGGFNKWKQEN